MTLEVMTKEQCLVIFKKNHLYLYSLDPRNDPRRPEYWDIRTRRQSQDQINFEEAFNNKARKKEKLLMRRAMIALALGLNGLILDFVNISTNIFRFSPTKI